MSKFDRIAQVAASAAAALFLSTLSVAAAVGPARSAETTPIVTAAVAQSATAHG
jgi:hypothetical protein